MRTSIRLPYTLNRLPDALATFWWGHPALLTALAVATAITVSATGLLAAAAPLAALAFPMLRRKHWRLTCLSVAVATCAGLYTSSYYQLPDIPDRGTRGTITFHINTLKTTFSHGRPFDVYSGRASDFIENGHSHQSGTHFPCTVRVPHRTARYLANTDYVIEGALREYAPGRYSLKPSKRAWEPVSGTWSLAEQRYRWKGAVATVLAQSISDGPVLSFLTGLATGEFGDRLLALEFSRFGLQHIMAISGFHFAIVAALLQLLLRPLLPSRVAAGFLILLLSSYYLFLGSSASIQRAWVGAGLVLLAQLLERSHRPMNTLGVAMLVVLACDPLQVLSLGFQLSFGITAAILLFYGPFEAMLRTVVGHQRLAVTSTMGASGQHGYVILSALRNALALTLAVHVIAIPVILLYFHKFPLMGLLYNLFFPLLTSISMLLLMLGLLATPIPPLAGALHSANGAFTSFLIDTVFDAPISLDVCIRCRSLSIIFVAVWLTLAAGVGIVLSRRDPTFAGIR